MKVNEDDLRTIFPYNSEFFINVLDENKKNEYFHMYSVYRELFTKYIINKLGLKNYDNKLENSDLEFLKIEPGEMDIYQYFSSDKLNYFYIRNNIYLEKLTEEEKQFLKELSDEQEMTMEVEEFIERTFKKLIFEDISRNVDSNSKRVIMYGPDSSNFMADNDALVIGLRYNEFAKNGVDSGNVGELYVKQLVYLEKFLNEMKQELYGTIDAPIAIIKYNEFSINKRVSEKQKTNRNNEKEEIK